MENRIIVTLNDYQRLMGLIELASLKMEMPAIVNRLFNNLSSAKMLKREDIDGSIVTMNSRVKLRDLTGKGETELTITYPQDAEEREDCVSVFSEIGLALFGRKEEEVIFWRTADGIRVFEITEVTYQPEAAGDYYL